MKANTRPKAQTQLRSERAHCEHRIEELARSLASELDASLNHIAKALATVALNLAYEAGAEEEREMTGSDSADDNDEIQGFA